VPIKKYIESSVVEEGVEYAEQTYRSLSHADKENMKEHLDKDLRTVLGTIRHLVEPWKERAGDSRED
jgi:hypothetical protein